MSHDTKRRESAEVYDHSVSLLELITAQVSAQRLGRVTEIHRLQVRINALERLSRSQPIRII